MFVFWYLICMTKYLIVGLGNPGREYAFNRHNVGFMAVSRLAAKHQAAFTRKQGKALVTSIKFDEKQAILAKPQTYMNLSGEAVQSLLKFYDIPLEQLLVCFDELDLPVGTIRLRPEGGSSGQNGMKSIIERLGTPKFPRLRLGSERREKSEPHRNEKRPAAAQSPHPALSPSRGRGGYEKGHVGYLGTAW